MNVIKKYKIMDDVYARSVCVSPTYTSADISLMKKYAFKEVDLVQIGVARAEPAGNLHLMKALNPVFIISGAGGNRDD